LLQLVATSCAKISPILSHPPNMTTTNKRARPVSLDQPGLAAGVIGAPAPASTAKKLRAHVEVETEHVEHQDRTAPPNCANYDGSAFKDDDEEESEIPPKLLLWANKGDAAAIFHIVYGSNPPSDHPVLHEKTFLAAAKFGARRHSAILDLDSADGEDKLTWHEVSEPFGGESYDILVDNTSALKNITLTAKERQVPGHTKDFTGKGWEVELKIDKVPCMGDHGSGTMKIMKAWKGDMKHFDASPEDKEKLKRWKLYLYEVFIDLKVVYGPRTRRGGHGPGERYEGKMWAAKFPLCPSGCKCGNETV
jgi:hypothetical protein